MIVCPRWRAGLSRLALAVVILGSTGLALRWVFLVPIFQSPDEPEHFDYALALNDHRGLLRARPDVPPTARSHPHTDYLARRTHFQEIRENPCAVCVSLDYGSRAYFAAIDREAPPRPAPRDVTAPGLASLYPFGYYALLAVWLEGVRWVAGPGPATLLLGGRCLSVVLLAISLVFLYGTLREMGMRRPAAILLLACIGCFPLVSFVGSYVQPDNLGLTLVSAGFYLGRRLYREPNNPAWQAALGAVLGALLVTKLHFALCLMLPAAALLASRWLTSRPGRIGAARAVALLAIPSVGLGLLHAWLTARVTNYFSPPAPYTGFTRFYLEGFTNALHDFLVGNTHQSFWGHFGWMNVPLAIGTPPVNQTVRFAVQAATWVVLALTLVRLEQVAAGLVRVARRGHVRRACQIAFSNLPVNSLFLFTVLMFALYIRLNNRFGAQGRNWLPFVLPLFWISLIYAPRALRSGALRSLLRTAVLAGLVCYAAFGSFYALRTIRSAYYPPPDLAARAWREAVVVRCPVGPTEDCRPSTVKDRCEWSFLCPIDSPQAVEVLLSPPRCPNPGTLTLRLLSEDGCLLGVSRLDATRVREKGYQPFVFQTLAGLKDRSLRLVLTCEPGTAGSPSGVEVWTPGPAEGFAARLVAREPGMLLGERGPCWPIDPRGAQQQAQPIALAAGPVQYEVVCPFASLQGIEMYLSTSLRINPGTVTLELQDEDGRPLGSATVEAPYLVDNSWRWFPLPGVSAVQGRRLRLRLSCTVPPGQNGAVVAWTGSGKPGVLWGRLRGGPPR